MFRVCSLAALVPLAFALASCKEDQAAAPTEPPFVQTVLVGAPDTSQQRFTGIVRARVESALGFRVGGKIVTRLVDPGMRVRKGQPLLRLDPADLSLALTSARANVEAARADLVRASAEQSRQAKKGTRDRRRSGTASAPMPRLPRRA